MAIEISSLLAQFWGWLSVIVGLVFLLRKKVLEEVLLRLSKDKGYVLLSGWSALILGLFTVILHNAWVAEWRIVITIFGWLSLVKGIARLGFPEVPEIPSKMIRIIKNKPYVIRVLCIIIIFLGAWLIWMSLY